ncbi:MAG: IS66 family transposase [Planctomycetota bacterium]|nr:IS66 family transposase [Planctomycetota bacterium]
MDDRDVILKRLEKLETELVALRKENEQLRTDNHQLRSDNDQLRIANQQLALDNVLLRDEIARLKKNSSNSSKPPSSDIVSPPKLPLPRGKKRKRGGQRGHPRHQRPPFDVTQIDQVIYHELPPADVRRRRLKRLKDCFIVQQVELVDKPYLITEHRAARYLTPEGRIIVAPMPPQVRRGGLLGPKLTGVVGWMKASAHISYTRIGEFFADVLGLPISRGELARRCTGMLSAALAPVYEELVEALRHEPVLGSDETGHAHAGKNFWTWCLRAPKFTVFHIDPSRGSAVLTDLLGQDYAGILTVDYFSANRAFADRSDARAQYCWAHLLREVKFLCELGRAGLTRWAEGLLAIARKMFRAWHRRTGADPPRWRRRMERHKRAFLDKMRRAPCHSEARTLARRFDRKGAPAYFRFLDAAGVEPTNNATERAIRQPVLDRRVTQGTRSPRGIAWCQRAWTAAATCAQQGRSTFRFLCDALRAHLTNAPAPSLLPINP